MNSEWGNDRRSSPRHGLDLNRSVRARVVAEGEGAIPIALYLVDLSEGGMRINLDRKLPEGQNFELLLAMEGLGFDGGEVLKVECQVAWQRALLGEAWVAGLKFLALDEVSKSLLRDVMDQFDSPGRRMRFRMRSVVPVSVRFEDDWFYMTATDLSPDGLRIRTTPVPWLSVGSEVTLWVHLGSQWPLEPLEAEVLWREEVWRDRIDVGLRFSELDEDEARLICEYIESSLQEEEAAGSAASTEAPT